MTKQKGEGKRVRLIEQASIFDKKFGRHFEGPKKLQPKIPPLVVLADLRRGSLASLDKYLAQEGGLPDRKVAVELRKLISGSRCRSRFKLLVINHPNGPKREGGRPKGKKIAGTDRYRHIAARYRQVVAEVGKAWRAKELISDEFKCSKSTVERAIRDSRKSANRKQSAAEANKRRKTAIGRLRKHPAEIAD